MNMAALTAQEKLDLIYVNLQEVLKCELIEDIVLKQQRPLKIYWGSATTGRPHCGYFVPIVKIAQFLRAGCTVKILLADVHGFLDNLKAPEELVGFRAQYYKFVITSLFKSVNVPVERLEFVLGSSYQESKPYIRDLYRLSTVVTEHDAKKAGSEVVKQVTNTVMSSLLYPLMQVLDEEHLGVDAQFGGVDQRKIFTLATEALPRIGYKERAHMMNPMVPGLAGGKMSSSDLNSKIDILDTPEQVTKKLRKAEAVPKIVEGNGIISFVEYVLLPVSSLKYGGNGKFLAKLADGEVFIYENIEAIKKDYAADKLTPQILKASATEALIALLEPIQQEFQASQEWQKVERNAYPPPETPQKKEKEKKKKDKGTRHPNVVQEVTVQERHKED